MEHELTLEKGNDFIIAFAISDKFPNEIRVKFKSGNLVFTGFFTPEDFVEVNEFIINYFKPNCK